MAHNRAKRLSGINTLAYLGIEPITAPLLIVKFNNEIPTTDDRAGNQIGAVWVSMDTAAGANNARIFVLTRLDGSGPSGIATWTELETGGSGMGVDFFTTDDGNTAIPNAGNINLSGGTSVGGIATNINTFTNPNNSENVFIALDNSIAFPDTIDINNGVITFGGTAAANRFLHNFGVGGGADCNTFLGLGAGNFTLTATQLTGIGCNALSSITDATSSRVTAVGSDALRTLTIDCINNTALGVEAGRNLQQASSCVLVGYQAGLNINTTPVGQAGTRTIAIGTQAMGVGDVTGVENIMIGFQSGENITSGNRNIGIGARAMDEITTAIESIAIGTDALGAFLTGSDCVAIGDNAMLLATTSTDCVVIGSSALSTTLASTDCIAIGTNALLDCTANNNIGIGTFALQNVSTGTRNIGILTSAQALTTGNDIIAIGQDALNAADTESNSIAIGSNALENYNASLGTLESSLAIGFNALQAADGSQVRMVAIGDSAMATGHGNNSVAIGFEAGAIMGLATSCVLLGFQAGHQINSGDLVTARGNRSIAIGALALGNAPLNASGAGTTTASENIAIGHQSLELLDDSEHNTFVGSLSGVLMTSDAHRNTSIGHESLANLVSGTDNTCIGNRAGNSLTTNDSNNILIGGSQTGIAGDNGRIRIGSVNQTTCFIAGIRGVTTGVADAINVLIDSANQLGTVSSSARYKDAIRDMADDSSAVMKLRPVTFHYKNDEQKRLQYGLIAEEVEEVMPRLVVYDEDGLPQSVRYNDLPQILLNELQKIEKRLRRLEQVSCTQCGHHVG